MAGPSLLRPVTKARPWVGPRERRGRSVLAPWALGAVGPAAGCAGVCLHLVPQVKRHLRGGVRGGVVVVGGALKGLSSEACSSQCFLPPNQLLAPSPQRAGGRAGGQAGEASDMLALGRATFSLLLLQPNGLGQAQRLLYEGVASGAGPGLRRLGAGFGPSLGATQVPREQGHLVGYIHPFLEEETEARRREVKFICICGSGNRETASWR